METTGDLARQSTIDGRDRAPLTLPNAEGGFLPVGQASDDVTSNAPRPLPTDRVSISDKGRGALGDEAIGEATQDGDAENDGLPESGKADGDSKEDSPEVEREVAELKQTEREVIAHEQAHKAVGGMYAGAPSYSYSRGPDGKSYITGGEVSIDTSKEDTPEETARKMAKVRAAALAPANPSPQDLSVAASASQMEAQARAEIAAERAKELGAGDDEDKNGPGVKEDKTEAAKTPFDKEDKDSGKTPSISTYA
jgi:hypothetical protein